MGVEHTVIMLDEFDWQYVGLNKGEVANRLFNEIEALGRPRPSVVAQWYGALVVDFGKTPACMAPYRDKILLRCDAAWVQYDNALTDLRRIGT